MGILSEGDFKRADGEPADRTGAGTSAGYLNPYYNHSAFEKKKKKLIIFFVFYPAFYGKVEP